MHVFLVHCIPPSPSILPSITATGERGWLGGKRSLESAHLNTARSTLRTAVFYAEDSQDARSGDANGAKNSNGSNEDDAGWLLDPFGLLVRHLRDTGRGGCGCRRLGRGAATAAVVVVVVIVVNNARRAGAVYNHLACSSVKSGQACAFRHAVGG